MPSSKLGEEEVHLRGMVNRKYIVCYRPVSFVDLKVTRIDTHVLPTQIRPLLSSSTLSSYGGLYVDLFLVPQKFSPRNVPLCFCLYSHFVNSSNHLKVLLAGISLHN